MKWNLIIDVAECENCSNCVLAAKDELVGNDFPGYSAPHAPQGPGVIRIDRQIRGARHLVDATYVPRMCNHCDNGPCLEAGRDGSIRKRDDGIVIIDPVKAKGRKDLVESCPYGAIVWNEEQQLPQTWFFDAHLLDSGWSSPRCVGVCPTEAITALKVTDETMATRVQEQSLRVLKPELGTQARVYYRNLQRVDSLLLAGSVCVRSNGRVDCVAGASIELATDGEAVASASTDAFGDFRLDGLAVGRYQLTVSGKGCMTSTQEIVLSGSVVLDDLELTLS